MVTFAVDSQNRLWMGVRSLYPGANPTEATFADRTPTFSLNDDTCIFEGCFRLTEAIGKLVCMRRICFDIDNLTYTSEYVRPVLERCWRSDPKSRGHRRAK